MHRLVHALTPNHSIATISFKVTIVVRSNVVRTNAVRTNVVTTNVVGTNVVTTIVARTIFLQKILLWHLKGQIMLEIKTLLKQMLLEQKLQDLKNMEQM
jgi:hypothetical protein